VNGTEVAQRTREVTLHSGDIFRIEMNAGGGYGDPLDRDPELVLGDVLDGYVSLSGAREDYGVVINPETHIIDTNATTLLRNQIGKK